MLLHGESKMKVALVTVGRPSLSPVPPMWLICNLLKDIKF